MFDIAWSEMVLIGAVALVVIGPKDLPKALRTVGQTVGRIRRMASEFQGQFNEAMREAELADLKKQVEDVGGSVSSALNNDFKPIETPKEFDPAKAEEEALKQAEAKLADLPMPELPPLDIAAETPTPEVDALPAAKPKRARKAKAEEPPPELAQPEQAAAASPEPEAPAKPARKRSVKVVTDAPEEADTPFPEVKAVAEPAPAKPVRRRKPKADTSAETKNEENSA